MAKTSKTATEKKTSDTKSAKSPQMKKSATQQVDKISTKAKVAAQNLSPKIGTVSPSKFRGNPDIFGALVADHDKHRLLFAQIEETVGDSRQRKILFKELHDEIKGHAAAEEQALWSTILRKPPTTEEGRHAVAEHHEMDEMLADLAASDMATSGWLNKFKKVKEEYLHHIKEEEKELFLKVEKHLTSADQKYMRSVFAARKKAEKAKAIIKPKKKKK